MCVSLTETLTTPLLSTSAAQMASSVTSVGSRITLIDRIKSWMVIVMSPSTSPAVNKQPREGGGGAEQTGSEPIMPIGVGGRHSRAGDERNLRKLALTTRIHTPLSSLPTRNATYRATRLVISSNRSKGSDDSCSFDTISLPQPKSTVDRCIAQGKVGNKGEETCVKNALAQATGRTGESPRPKNRRYRTAALSNRLRSNFWKKRMEKINR